MQFREEAFNQEREVECIPVDNAMYINSYDFGLTRFFCCLELELLYIVNKLI